MIVSFEHLQGVEEINLCFSQEFSVFCHLSFNSTELILVIQKIANRRLYTRIPLKKLKIFCIQRSPRDEYGGLKENYKIKVLRKKKENTLSTKKMSKI